MDTPSPTRTPAAETFTQLILETFRLNGRLLAAGDKLTKNLGLSSALWQVLGAVETAPLTMAQIARKMGLTRQSVRRTVTVLVDRGFVAFQTNPDHQRAQLVDLTPSGRKALQRTTDRQADWANDIAADFSPKDIAAGVRLLRALSERL